MSENSEQVSIDALKKTQENIAVVIGVFIALTLSVYFFTYAMLVDKGYSGMLWTQGISSLLMLATLLKLKRVSIFLARLLLRRKAAHKQFFATKSIADLEKL